MDGAVAEAEGLSRPEIQPELCSTATPCQQGGSNKHQGRTEMSKGLKWMGRVMMPYLSVNFKIELHTNELHKSFLNSNS